MTTESVRHIEMTWRCSSCQHQNLGRHKRCVECDHPKDGSEEWEMPEDPSQAASVTDADLLRMATAGPDWRCAYCGSDQRRGDNGCANCGASAVEGTAHDELDEPAPAAAAAAAPAPRRRRKLAWFAVPTLAVAGLIWNAKRPRDYDATVGKVAWERSIEVERWAARDKEGFKEAMPREAFEVHSLGQRLHHHEQVLDGYTPERYSVEVPDGARTETYSARVACGQDCTTTPRSCRETCKSDKNGFATCRTTCSGGGQRCSTRYCDETRTRQVARTRTEWRTRQVPRYRQEPRYAEAFKWKLWEWAPARTLRAAGGDLSRVRWPEEEAKLGVGLAAGEKERDQRRARYVVTLRYEDRDLSFEVPTPEVLALFAPGSRHRLHREGDKLTVDGSVITPLETP